MYFLSRMEKINIIRKEQTMRKLYLFTIGMLALLCTACEKELDTYAGESGIYFDTFEMFDDTVRVPWGLKNSEIREQSLGLKVCLYGNTADYDRKFGIEVVTESGDEWGATEGVDYRPLVKECVIPANEAEALIHIELLRNEMLKEHPKRFTVKLVEGPELRFIYTRETSLVINSDNVETRALDFQRVIYMNESFPMPRWWYVYGNTYFGDFTPTKAALICDVMDIDREDFVDSDALTQGYLKFVGKYMHRWLQENPQLDENGEPMEMGEASKG